MTALLAAFKIIPIWLWLALAGCIAFGLEAYRLHDAQSQAAEYKLSLDESNAQVASLTLSAKQQKDLADQANAISQKYQGAIADAAKQNDSLAADLAASRKRLQVHGKCVPSGTASPANLGGSDAATFRLDDEARQNYLDLRSGLIQQRAQITGLQERVLSLEKICKI